MEERIEVLFGYSYTSPDTTLDATVMKKVWRIGCFEDHNGKQSDPVDDADTDPGTNAESLLAQTDMNCKILTIPQSSLDNLTQKHMDFVRVLWGDPIDEEKVEHLNKEFPSVDRT